MEENPENVTPVESSVPVAEEPPAPPSEGQAESVIVPDVAAPLVKAETSAPKREERRDQPRSDRGPRPDRGPRSEKGPRPDRDSRGDRGDRGGRPEGHKGGGQHREGGGYREGRPGGGPRGFEPMADIDIEKLISDSLYLDNQAHAVVARMRDMDSGTKSQLRRLYNAVRRAVRAPEGDRQHQFVMLRARLAYTIARHSLRSLDGLERLLLQVTRKNDAKGYERFKDLFEAIVAYNE